MLAATIDAQFDQRLKELAEWLKIPSISALPQHRDDVYKAGEWARAYLENMGFAHTAFVETEGLPVVYAEHCPYPDKPTLLFYGHVDVQPADPLELWQSPPFEATIRDGKLFARGANDDKGQCMVWLGALQALKAVHGNFPVNIKVVLESEEEIGGHSIETYVKAHAEQLKCDAVVVCDTSMYSPEHPSICTSLRGIVYNEVIVRGGKTDMHSGMYGGVAPNPLHALALLIGRLKDEDGKIQIPELLAAVPDATADEVAFWDKDPVGFAAGLLGDMATTQLYGENEHSAYARTGLRPTLEVHGIVGGFMGEGSKTVIPAEAKAKMSLRLPPGMAPQPALEAFKNAVAAHMPHGYAVEVKNLGMGAGMMTDWNNPFMLTARKAMASVYGKEPVPMRMGGSVPVCAVFDSVLMVPVLLVGFGLPDDDLHAPNEKYSLDQLKKGMNTLALFMDELGR
ncbi:MAG: dipeptidase [Alphaproteobacteria bacterium]|nr:MAG: dipeptidase [Alphaproteobacteria bacterium]